jgi:hypothetical protein
MSTRKYSVTIEDWPEDEVMSSQTGADQPHLYQYGETSVYDHSPSDGEKESWVRNGETKKNCFCSH